MPSGLLLASTNAKKYRELCRLCQDLPLPILSPKDLSFQLPEVEEDQPDFVGNAKKKALSAAFAVAQRGYKNLWVLADDSGLMVDALNGSPGVHSARYSGVAGDGQDAANNRKLLAALAGIPEANRGAGFYCCLAVADANSILFTAEGKVRGRILLHADGDAGFGYDPLFYHPPSASSFARLRPEQKAAVSHRGRAFAQLKIWLQEQC